MDTDTVVSDTSEDTGGDADLSSDDSLGGLPFTDAANVTEDSDDDSFEFGGEDDGQDEPHAAPSDKPLTPEEIMAKMAGEKTPAQAALTPEQIKAINSLGAVWKNQPIEVKDQKELVDYIQKGFDYTRKSMERAELEKQKEAEYAERETKWKQREEAFEGEKQKYQQQLHTFNMLDRVFRKLERTDPDMADAFANLLREENESANAHNPVIEALNAKTGQLEKTLQEIRAEREAEKVAGVRQGYEKEKSEVQSKFASVLNQLGVNPVWDKVDDVWKSDLSQKMTYEQALYSVYGKDITTAYESKTKLQQAKLNKQIAANNKSATRTGGSKVATPKKYAPGDYESILRS